MRYLVFFILFLPACMSLKVETQYDEKTNFSDYKTWCWLDCNKIYTGPDYLYDSSLIDNISNVIAAEMHSKGYIQGDENSDILVNFHLIFQEDSTYFRRVNMHDDELTFWAPYREEFFHFIDGSLLIDIADRKKGQLIWRSNARRLLSYNQTVPLDKIQLGIKKAMKDFPPEESD